MHDLRVTTETKMRQRIDNLEERLLEAELLLQSAKSIGSDSPEWEEKFELYMCKHRKPKKLILSGEVFVDGNFLAEGYPDIDE